ncbi:antibiotic biosynthesis monooxygenase [Vibrio tritonius]|uniref:Antibiotic biosynthesis monooxygenase n=1 Tax=Vibrio tritonius TaxID=1435069 RepID=A0ABS7YTN9_9VIBR|nr:putative quinol monooxygenase [Vibrio tritonius]MCA2018432.1 antibiotic biosynthesis monooxygenase [Vibrio tritonius]
MATVHVFAEIKANEGYENELEKALCGLLEPSREELGCCQFELYRDKTVSDVFILQEIWISQRSLDLHMESDHFQSFLTSIQENQWVEYITPRTLNFLG